MINVVCISIIHSHLLKINWLHWKLRIKIKSWQSLTTLNITVLFVLDLIFPSSSKQHTHTLNINIRSTFEPLKGSKIGRIYVIVMVQKEYVALVNYVFTSSFGRVCLWESLHLSPIQFELNLRCVLLKKRVIYKLNQI